MWNINLPWNYGGRFTARSPIGRPWGSVVASHPTTLDLRGQLLLGAAGSLGRFDASAIRRNVLAWCMWIDLCMIRHADEQKHHGTRTYNLDWTPYISISPLFVFVLAQYVWTRCLNITDSILYVMFHCRKTLRRHYSMLKQNLHILHMGICFLDGSVDWNIETQYSWDFEKSTWLHSVSNDSFVIKTMWDTINGRN